MEGGRREWVSHVAGRVSEGPVRTPQWTQRRKWMLRIL